jgi:hypothetical protein
MTKKKRKAVEPKKIYEKKRKKMILCSMAKRKMKTIRLFFTVIGRRIRKKKNV